MPVARASDPPDPHPRRTSVQRTPSDAAASSQAEKAPQLVHMEELPFPAALPDVPVLSIEIIEARENRSPLPPGGYISSGG